MLRFLLFIPPIVLAACGGGSQPAGSVRELLGLATDKPTLAFFYTDG
jgi:hypothetical protein